jgi:hypothetical protein
MLMLSKAPLLLQKEYNFANWSPQMTLVIAKSLGPKISQKLLISSIMPSHFFCDSSHILGQKGFCFHVSRHTSCRTIVCLSCALGLR